MQHSFMAALSAALAERGVATLRFQFPYMERGSRRTDPPPIAHAAVRAACARALDLMPNATLFAGGKSFGGRMTSQAQAELRLNGVRGLIFVGFPLHPAGKPSLDRAQHLSNIHCPMLFLQGTRDDLADLELISDVVMHLGDRATLKLFEDADHSFHVRARSGRTDAQVLSSLADGMVDWMHMDWPTTCPVQP
ncbi:MAG: dienelactone hydrolase family protein [Burkholderiaceae bacterium]|nr:dienelactone hydrolase family protein [Burkholderiaceae bacterium]